MILLSSSFFVYFKFKYFQVRNYILSNTICLKHVQYYMVEIYLNSYTYILLKNVILIVANDYLESNLKDKSYSRFSKFSEIFYIFNNESAINVYFIQ